MINGIYECEILKCARRVKWVGLITMWGKATYTTWTHHVARHHHEEVGQYDKGKMIAASTEQPCHSRLNEPCSKYMNCLKPF